MKLQVAILVALLTLLTPGFSNAQFSVEKSDRGVKVLHEGKLVTEYLTASPSPILWPIMSSDGVKLTRDYPMIDSTEGEKHDHPHHRSAWFTHGEVNGNDFWAKSASKVVHQSYGKIEGGANAVIESTNAWMDSKDVRLLTEKRRMTFGADSNGRWVDFEAVLISDVDEVNFGDTKEGTFAVRVAETMKVDAKLGGKIVNSEGLEDAKAWGKRAKWVNYTGPINGKTYGIAMFCHPETVSYPNRWHVRTYGLFAANPFGGTKPFDEGGELTKGTTIKRNEQLKFKYRIMWHNGITDSKVLDAVFDSFSKTAFPKL